MKSYSSKKGSNIVFGVAVVIAIIIIGIVIGGYFVLFSGGSTVKAPINKMVSINGSSENQTFVLSNQSVYVITNYSSIKIIINTTHVVPVDVVGHDNAITIVNGTIDIYVSGNYDRVYTKNTNILNRSITGTGDSVS